MYTTLNKIRQNKPCEDGWEKLLKFLKKTKGDDDPLSLLTVLESNDLEDAVWTLRAVDGFDREKRLFAVRCARRVQHLLTGPKAIEAIDVAERFAYGNAAAAEELKEASYDAWTEAVHGAWVDGMWVNNPTVSAAWAAVWAANRLSSEAAWLAAAAELRATGTRAEQEADFRRLITLC